jgi:hypothetical protein
MEDAPEVVKADFVAVENDSEAAAVSVTVFGIVNLDVHYLYSN